MNNFKISFLIFAIVTLNLSFTQPINAATSVYEVTTVESCQSALADSSLIQIPESSTLESNKSSQTNIWIRRASKAQRWISRWAKDHFVPPSSDLIGYNLSRKILGRGYSGVIYEGTLPINFRYRFEELEQGWQAQKTNVVLKVSRPQLIHQLTLENESNMSQRLSQFDKDGLFLRYHLDKLAGALVSTKVENAQTLEQWLRRNSNSPSTTIEYISSQLTKALDILTNAHLVHSDLSLQNILIDPNTLKITIIDFGVTAEVGKFAPQRQALSQNRRGGIFKSANQEADLPAQFEDDEFAVNEILKLLRNPN